MKNPNPNDLEYPHVADSPTCLPALPELGTGRTKSKATSISRTSLCWSVELMASSSRSSLTSLRSAGITSWISVPEWLYVYWDPMYSMSWRHVFQWQVHTRTTIGFWQQHVPLSHFLPEIEMKPAISNISRTWMFSWASESANSCCQIIVVWNNFPFTWPSENILSSPDFKICGRRRCIQWCGVGLFWLHVAGVRCWPKIWQNPQAVPYILRILKDALANVQF